MTAKIIAVLGGGGAPGATTVACHLSENLRKRGGGTVCLMDWDLSGAVLPLLLGLDDNGAMTNLYQMAKIAGLSDEVINMATQTLKDGYTFVSGFRGLERYLNFDSDVGWRILSDFATRNDYLVLDWGRLSIDTSLLILQKVDFLVWVVTPTPSGALNWRKTWQIIDGANLSLSKMNVVVNQDNHPKRLLQFAQEWKEYYGIPIMAKFPYIKTIEPEFLVSPDLLKRDVANAINNNYKFLITDITKGYFGDTDFAEALDDDAGKKKFKLFGRNK